MGDSDTAKEVVKWNGRERENTGKRQDGFLQILFRNVVQKIRIENLVLMLSYSAIFQNFETPVKR